MHVGYARVSTKDQNLALQHEALNKAGCGKVYEDKVSGAKTIRQGLDLTLEVLREGDSLVVWKLDRLGRNVKDLVILVGQLENQGIHFKSLTESIDTSSTSGRFFFHVMASLAQMERELLLERTQAGLEAARKRGRVGGRKRSMWENLEEDIGSDRFNALFSHIRMIKMRAKSRSNMVSDFKQNILPDQNPIAFIDEILEPYTRIYSEILDQNFSSHSFEEAINRSLFWLRRVDNSDWVPVAIYYMGRYRDEPERLSKFLDYLEKLASVQMINRVSINYRITRYTEILSAVDKDIEFREASKLYLSETEKNDALEQLNGPVYKLRKIRTMVLLRLDSELSDNMAQYNHSKITIEHVMPQNPADDSVWKRWCPDEEEHQELVHCLGNLVLLSRNKNSAASNYEFDKKKTAYFNPVSGHTAFVLTSQIISEEEWKPELIRARKALLVNKLATVWKLES